MENFVIHKANSRGFADHVSLQARHTFSFENYLNPDRMNFGALRVLNEDVIGSGKGLDIHQDENTEIITIPLEGSMEYKDNMGNFSVLKKGDIQVMSAGNSVRYSKYNKNEDEVLKLMQIWVYQKKSEINPHYQQITLTAADRKNKLQQIVSPDPEDDGAWIYQDAWIYLGNFDQDVAFGYRTKKHGNGIYVFIISGSANILGQKLEISDGMGIWGSYGMRITANSPDTEILIMEVPMKVQH